ncbi:MAG: YezD family protein [Gammaproteobacteria bacterium]
MAEMLKEPTGLDSPDLVQQVLRALRGIRYGSVELVVHDGRVVQIERKEKLRFERSDPRHSG